MKRILFRADSSSAIGTGHIMRDLVLAQQFGNAQIIFAVRELEGNINHKIKEQNYVIKILRSNKLEELDSLIKKIHPDMIVIDHYGIDYDFEQEIKQKNPTLKIMVLDDIYKKHHCDILLNHNIYAKAEKYQGLLPEDCELRCGSEFTLLRDEFIQVKQDKTIEKTFYSNILIAMGGTDVAHLNIKILKLLKSFQNIHVFLITTSANPNLKQLKKFIDDKDWIDLHIDTSHMAKLLAQSNLAIVTPSVILNEVCYMKVPFIAIQVANNQSYMAQFLHAQNKDILDSYNVNHLKKLLYKHLLKDSALIGFSQLTLQEQTMIFEWRNHPEVRKWMYNKEIIPLKEHLSYINSLDEKDDRCYFLVKKDNQNIGVIDFTSIDKETSSAEIGVYSKPDTKGVGSILMQQIVYYALNDLKLKTLYSNVYSQNDKAIKLYQRFGFKELKRDRELIYMELSL